MKSSQKKTPNNGQNTSRAQPAIVTFICISAHLFVLFILANLNFRNIPHLFSFLSGAAEAMNQNDAVSEGLESVRRSVGNTASFQKACHPRLATRSPPLQVFVRATGCERNAASGRRVAPVALQQSDPTLQWFDQQKQQQQQNVQNMSTRCVSARWLRLLQHCVTNTGRYMYDFQNDRPLVAGVWQKVTDAPP